MPNDAIFLQLGRLDARLKNSIGLTSWQLAMRVRGIALTCRNAGLPVADDEVRDWISGLSSPPRHLVGLEDPLRVPAAAHHYLQALTLLPKSKMDESHLVLEKLFDARAQAAEWASEEAQSYDGLFETLSNAVSEREFEQAISSVADTLSALMALAKQADDEDMLEGKSFQSIKLDRPALAWLVSVFTPALLVRAGLTENLMPQMIPHLRFLNISKDHIEAALTEMLETEVRKGQSMLAAVERSLSSVRDNLLTNRRSKTWDAAIITAAFPDIKRERLASAINVRPQGAGYIKSRIFGSAGKAL